MGVVTSSKRTPIPPSTLGAGCVLEARWNKVELDDTWATRARIERFFFLRL